MHILWFGISAWQDKMDQHLLLLQTFIVYKLQNLGTNVLVFCNDWLYIQTGTDPYP